MNSAMIREMVGSKFFSVVFTKSDGTERKMTARLGVKKYLKGGELKHDPSQLNHLIVFDMAIKQYRTINFNTIKEIRFKGKVITFSDNSLEVKNEQS
jgi:hypothetical protein